MGVGQDAADQRGDCVSVVFVRRLYDAAGVGECDGVGGGRGVILLVEGRGTIGMKGGFLGAEDRDVVFFSRQHIC